MGCGDGEEIFTTRDANYIIRIPLNWHEQSDSIIWHHDRWGNYTVRSGYHVARRIVLMGDLLQRSLEWNKIWALTIPPKIKQFLYRACNESLLIRAALSDRGMPVSPVCAMFDSHIEA